MVSCGVRLSEVGFGEIPKPQVAVSIPVAGSIPCLTRPGAPRMALGDGIEPSSALAFVIGEISNRLLCNSILGSEVINRRSSQRLSLYLVSPLIFSIASFLAARLSRTRG